MTERPSAAREVRAASIAARRPSSGRSALNAGARSVTSWGFGSRSVWTISARPADAMAEALADAAAPGAVPPASVRAPAIGVAIHSPPPISGTRTVRPESSAEVPASRWAAMARGSDEAFRSSVAKSAGSVSCRPQALL